MKKYIQVVKMSLIDENLFKMNYYLSFISVPIQTLIIYYFWQVNMTSKDINGFTFNSIILYFVFMQVLLISYSSAMYIAYELWNDINRGTIITWLLRPISYPVYIFSKKIGIFIPKILSSLFLIYGFLYIFGFNFKIISIFPGLLSSIMGYIILSEIQYIIGSLTFWLKNVITLRDVVINILMLLGGLIIPIDFMPKIIQKISFATPMPSIYYYPVNILIGNINNDDLGKFILIQFIWIILLAFIIKMIWAKGSHMVEQGS